MLIFIKYWLKQNYFSHRISRHCVSVISKQYDNHVYVYILFSFYLCATDNESIRIYICKLPLACWWSKNDLCLSQCQCHFDQCHRPSNSSPTSRSVVLYLQCRRVRIVLTKLLSHLSVPLVTITLIIMYTVCSQKQNTLKPSIFLNSPPTIVFNSKLTDLQWI